MKTKLRLKGMRKLISRSISYAPKKLERARLAYNGGVKQLMIELEQIE